MSSRKNKGYSAVKGREETMRALRQEGKTYEEIANILGLRDGEVIRNCLRRENQRNKNLTSGYIPRPKGRPRKDGTLPIPNLETEIERLRMENELLRDFLHAVGRRCGHR